MECGLPWAQHVPVVKRKGGTLWLCPDEQAATDPDLDPYYERKRPSGQPFYIDLEEPPE